MGQSEPSYFSVAPSSMNGYGGGGNNHREQQQEHENEPPPPRLIMTAKSWNDLKTPSVSTSLPNQPTSSLNRKRPANLDLSQANSNSNNNSSNGLQTPNSATFYNPTATGSNNGNNNSTNNNNNQTPPSIKASSLHSKYRTPSLPVNNLVIEIPGNIKSISLDELYALISDYNIDADEKQHQGESNNKSTITNIPSPRSSSSNTPTNYTLLIDIRPFSQYSVERIMGAINICIPSTLLKRSTFDLTKFLDCMAPHQRGYLSDLSIYDTIVIYDQSSSQISATTNNNGPLLNTLLKFSKALYSTNSNCSLVYLQGGFSCFSSRYPNFIDKAFIDPKTFQATADGGANNNSNSTTSSTSIQLDPLPTSTNFLTGFSLPRDSVKDGPMKAFASNIRAEMEVFNDSIDINIPSEIYNKENFEEKLPGWLLNVLSQATNCKVVAKKFHELELTERDRLKNAFDPTNHNTIEKHQLAGVEMGTKNRYHNIWPFDHSRVKIQTPSCGGDYINANYIHTTLSKKKYIATQGPLPATYKDFWNVIWEQRVPVIIMLTPEIENGLLKCDAYWNANFENVSSKFNLRLVSQQVETLNPQSNENSNIIIRKFEMKSKFPMKFNDHQVVQIQYTNWPDFGSPASAEDLLTLSSLKQSFVDKWKADNNVIDYEPYTLVHCSAGCGRTGTFCTVDTCVDFFNQCYEKNVSNPTNDIVYQAVDDMRQQRLSMVQNLRQFAICYECIFLWWVKYQP